MSYQERYSTEVHYSGSVRYSYPASERGGSGVAHYEGTIPVDIDVTVDTDPFDRSIDGASGALAVVAGALSASEAAQVAQIQRSAKEISQTAIRGFYRTLTSELSAQASEFGSSMRSTVGLLAEHGKQVEHIHTQMESDYSAIKSRYARLFAELDRELDRRIHELDRPAFQLSEGAMRSVVAGPYEQSAAKVLVHTRDMSATPLKLICARAKACASSALRTLGRMCDYITGYSRSVKNVVVPAGDAGFVYVPVVYALQTDLANMQQRLVVHKSEAIDSGEVTRRVIAEVGNLDSTCWQQPTPEDRAALDRYFMQCLDKYSATGSGQHEAAYHERVCRQIMSLYQQAGTTTAYRG